MKKQSLILSFCILFGSPALAQKIYGSQHLYNQVIDSLEGAGEIKLTQIQSENEINVSGSLRAVRSSFKRLKVNGKGHLVLTRVKEDLEVNGELIAERCDMDGGFTVNGDTTLRKVKAHEVTIRGLQAKVEDSDIEHIIVDWSALSKTPGDRDGVFLKGNSKIKTIEFQGKPGKVRGWERQTQNLNVINGQIRKP